MVGVAVLGNDWGVTMYCSCPYWTWVVLQSQVMPGMLLCTSCPYWPWVVLQSQVMPGILPCTVVVPTAMGGVTVSGNA